MHKLWKQRTPIKGGKYQVDGDQYRMLLRFDHPGCQWVQVVVSSVYDQIAGSVIQDLITDRLCQKELDDIAREHPLTIVIYPAEFIEQWLSLNVGIMRSRVKGQVLPVSPRYYCHVSSRANPQMVLLNISDPTDGPSLYYLLDRNWVLEEHLGDDPPNIFLKRNAEIIIMPERVYLAQAFEEETDE